METLRHGYPYIREDDLKTALKYAEGNAEVALEILSQASLASVSSKQSTPTLHEAYLDFVVPSSGPPPEIEASLKGKNDMAETPGFSQEGPKDNDVKLRHLQTSTQNDDNSESEKETIECACCFDDFPVSEITCCSNTEPHLFCYGCAKRNAGEEIGKTKFTLLCMDGSGCKAPFEDSEIRRFLDKKTLDGLEQLRTQDEIQKAELEGLVHCPFCPFAAIMEDPTDTIFECENCGILSCRYCRVKSHHPLTCEKYKKEKHLSVRHVVEEAMTEALVRRCNKCAKPFLKEMGCNKMRCPCGNTQCFICSRDVFDYSHFSQATCPLNSDVTPLLEKQVADAQEKTVQQILRNREDLKDDDVRVENEVNIGAAQPRGPQGPNDPFNIQIDMLGQQFRQLANIGMPNQNPPMPQNPWGLWNLLQPPQIQPPAQFAFNPLNFFQPMHRPQRQQAQFMAPWGQFPPPPMAPYMFPPNIVAPQQAAPPTPPAYLIQHPNQPANYGQQLGAAPAGPPPFAAFGQQQAPPTPPATPRRTRQFDLTFDIVIPLPQQQGQRNIPQGGAGPHQ